MKILFCCLVTSLYCIGYIPLLRAQPKTDTTESRKYFLEGEAKFNKGDYNGAIKDFDLSINYNSRNWESYRGRGNAKTQLGWCKEAISDFNSALVINKKDGLTYQGRAEARLCVGEYISALEDYNLILKVIPSDQVSLFGRANCYRGIKKFQEAITDYSKLIRLAPNVTITYLQRGVSYNSINKYSEALSDFNNYILLKTLSKEDPSEAFYYRGIAYLNLQKPDSAIIDFENYFKTYAKFSEGMRLMGESYLAKGNIKMAKGYFQEAIALDSTNKNARFFLGYAFVLEKDFVKGKEVLKELGKKGDNPSKEFYYVLAVSEANTGEMDQAKVHIAKALQLDDTYLDAYYLRVDILSGNPSEYEQMLSDINKSIQLEKRSPSLAKLYFFRGILYARQNKFILAQSDMDKAIALEPGYPDFYAFKAYLMFYVQNLQSPEAEEKTIVNKEMFEEVDRAIKLDNKYWQSYAIKGMFYHYSGEKEKACVNIKMAKKLGGTVSNEVEEFFCKGKLPKNKETVDLEIFTFPKLPKELSK